MLRPDSFAATALLTGLVAFGPLSTDMYLPSLPAMTRDLGADVASVQLTLSVFLGAFGVAQLISGPLSDRFGRRPVLLGGVGLFFVASLGCVFAPNIETLILARFVQGIGACVGPSVGRAVVRDVHGREGAVRILGYMGSAMALGPMIAPPIGGWMVVWWDWRAIFVFLAVFGGFLLIAIASGLVETNRHRDPEATRAGRMVTTYLSFLGHRAYLGYVLCSGFVFAGMFAFISGSSFVIVDFMGVDPRWYGIGFGVSVSGFMAGSFLVGRFARHFRVETPVIAGGVVSALAGGLLCVLALMDVVDPLAIIVPQFVYLIGMGLVLPSSAAGAIGPFPDKAGAAAALLGTLQISMAALSGLLVGQLHDGTQMPMVWVIAASGVATLMASLLLRSGPDKAK